MKGKVTDHKEWRQFCNDCGKPLKVQKRRADYDVGTGEIRGWYVETSCGWWKLLCGVYWEYEYNESTLQLKGL